MRERTDATRAGIVPGLVAQDRARAGWGAHAAFSPLTVVCGLALVILLIDLALAVTRSGAPAGSTPLLSVPPLVDVLLLGGVGGVALVARVRARDAFVRARAARLSTAEDAELLLQIIDNTSAVIYLRDLDGRFLLINRMFEQLFGISRQEIVGLDDFDVFPAETAEQFRANDLRALANDAPFQIEETVPHRDGPHTYVTVKYPIDDHTGRPCAICGISTDITELKQMQEHAQQLTADLEARVAKRTAELEASTRELDAFAYSVSHDLRAPLRALAGFSELLMEDYGGKLDPTGEDYLRRVVGAAKRMSRLIDDLLLLSQATRAELAWRPVDLTALAYRTVADLEAADPARAGQTEVEIQHGLRAAGDTVQLGLVLQNLISNAWKYTAKTERPRIQVGAEPGPDGDAAVYFVRDNGVGFDMRYAEKLFVPFQRLHSGTEFAGSGIGLAIVGRVISRHGGRIWAESSPGQGAVFRFELPRRRPGSEAAESARHAEPADRDGGDGS